MHAAQNHASRHVTTADRTAVACGCSALVAGVLVLLLTSGTVSSVIGVCLIGLCGVAFVALVFLRVGESEDRDYERERQ